MELKHGLQKVQKITDKNSGIYILELHSAKPFYLTIKKFSDHKFPPGYYYYIGSAQKNLHQRIVRHFKTAKKVHWHVDHLTTNKNIIITNCYVIFNAEKYLESIIANEFSEKFEGKIIVDNFGNSDTKNTRTHLFYRKKKISYNHFSARYQSIVRFNPSSKENS